MQDNNGYITSDEMQKFLGDDMKEKDENKWKEIISKCDSNHDGKISFPEFTAMMENMVPHD